MQNRIYPTKESVMRRALELVDAKVPFGALDVTGRLSEKNKGDLGQIIEEGWYGYKPNNEAEPDFAEAGVELKVSPYRFTRNGVSAKERLVCDIINYMEEAEKTFETSAFWHKCKCICLLSYQWFENVPKAEMFVDHATLLNEYPIEDLIIIKHDWEVIVEKIRAGEAHLLTEGDTMYLAACTKGATAETSYRQQPYSTIPAKQRAYSLKTTYMTHILRNYVFGEKEDEHIIKDWHLLQNRTFEEYIYERLEPYFGISQNSLKEHFNVSSTAKNLNEILLAKMLNIKGKIAYTDEFQKAGIVPKTIRVNKTGRIEQNMPFPTFKFTEIIEEQWEESTLYNYLAPTKFLFVIFREKLDGDFVFERVMFWNIPERGLEEVHKVWQKTVDTIKAGVVLNEVNGKIYNNLPSPSENKVAHVRPHARNRDDTYPLPDGRTLTKQCFWLNNTYIEAQIGLNKEYDLEIDGDWAKAATKVDYETS